ncbi:XdhC family protein [Vreelandella olivaria]|uniref:XdhC family protein n=1 Tax=Vreelandella olivaria TaxID=390919 RepID=UPI00201F8C35|nr:XdhC family protein [Halomonas olivaria]
MQHLDLQVIERALQWANQGQPLWLCTVLATFGSAPREPGAMMVACSAQEHTGSLSGGCVEEDFLTRLHNGEFSDPVQVIHYGGGEGASQVQLPCGGRLDVLVEYLKPNESTLTHLEVIHATLLGRHPLIRRIKLDGSGRNLLPADAPGPAVTRDAHTVAIRIGPALRLVIAGISAIATPCALFATSLGFEVIVCDPRDDIRRRFAAPGVEVQAVHPATFIASGGCHAGTAVVALTHDPRLDDLVMMEAVRTDAFYIGVMGSTANSHKRAERLQRSGGLSEAQLQRITMPIGLALGSKTPAEIALAVMADIVRTHRGKHRQEL